MNERNRPLNLSRVIEVKEEWYCCEHIFTSYTAIIVHTQLEHSPSLTVHGLNCGQCPYRFDRHDVAILHFISNHVAYLFRCQQCDIGFNYFGTFLDHFDDCLNQTSLEVGASLNDFRSGENIPSNWVAKKGNKVYLYYFENTKIASFSWVSRN